MAKELPYFKFFPAEWLLGSISDETDNIQGTFVKVMALYWHENCSITIDKLQRKVHKTKVKCLIDRNYIKIKNDTVCIEFLDEQYAELLDLSTKRSDAGKLGYQAKVKQGLSKPKARVKHLDKDKIREDKIIDREIKFRDSLTPFVETYGETIIKDFYDYWREPNLSKSKMRWEQQKTWDLNLRLKKWENNQDRWTK